jgi:DNA anti-recombination protein RmuC
MTTTHDERAGETDRPSGDPLAGGASIDKVRDILFGAQMREYDRRFSRLEERLLKETSDLKDDVRKRLGALEEYLKQELEALGQRLSTERGDREDAAKSLGHDLRETANAFDRKMASMDEQAARAQRDLRQQLLDQHQRLTDELQSRHAELLATLNREATELRDEKADRTALASLFTEMALRLNDQLRLPTPEGD